MNTVQPIKDIEIIYDIADYLKSRNKRNYVLFMFGIYSGLRISDILKLRVRDVRNKNYIYIREKKTNKEKRFILQDDIKTIICDFIKDKKDYEFLFKSNRKINKSITRQQAYRILRHAAEMFGLGSIGTHTLRKTFGYFLYKQTKDIVIVQEILGHSSVYVTRRYIGLEQDDKDREMLKLSYSFKR